MQRHIPLPSPRAHRSPATAEQPRRSARSPSGGGAAARWTKPSFSEMNLSAEIGMYYDEGDRPVPALGLAPLGLAPLGLTANEG